MFRSVDPSQYGLAIQLAFILGGALIASVLKFLDL